MAILREQHRPSPTQEIRCRRPAATDGATMHALVGEIGTLESNSAYAYVMMADMFSESCVLAEQAQTPEPATPTGKAVGFILGFRPPRNPRSIFVWQIGVHPDARRLGIARRMLDHVVERAGNKDVTEILTTVDTDNSASEGMFRAFARSRGASMTEIGGYPAEYFPGAHEAERLFSISGIRRPGRSTPDALASARSPV